MRTRQTDAPLAALPSSPDRSPALAIIPTRAHVLWRRQRGSNSRKRRERALSYR
jgi:hypothetical protein